MKMRGGFVVARNDQIGIRLQDGPSQAAQWSASLEGVTTINALYGQKRMEAGANGVNNCMQLDQLRGETRRSRPAQPRCDQDTGRMRIGPQISGDSVIDWHHTFGPGHEMYFPAVTRFTVSSRTKFRGLSRQRRAEIEL